MARPLRQFLALSPTDRSLLARAILLVAEARLAVSIFPFNVARRLIASGPPASTPYAKERIGWAVSVAKRFVPRGNCLPQALAAESLLLRSGYPVEFRIGVLKTSGERLEAHAWVESGGSLVVGDLTQGLAGYSAFPPLPDAKA